MLKIKQCCALFVGLFLSMQMTYAYATNPTAPTNVVAERTSDSTVYVSWSPSSDDVGVAGYKVFRDNKQISTVTNPRLNDIQLAPDTVYTYYVIAYDADGNHSVKSISASTGTVSSPEPSTSPTPQAGTSAGSDPANPVSVIGNRISWPDDGWYQVLDIPSYSEQCGGTRFCDVDAGRYLVINHSTGQRFPEIDITNDGSASTTGSTTDPAASVSVNGNRISWPDNGWYQVQNASTYAEVCSGVRFCDVSSGAYIVINHTTGKREQVSVQGTGAEAGVYFNSENALSHWANTVSVINSDRLKAFFVALEDEINFFGTTGYGPTGGIDGISSEQPTSVNPPYQLTESEGQIYSVSNANVYTCFAGGQLTQYLPEEDIRGFDIAYENCVVGENEYSGTVGARNQFRYETQRSHFDDFQRLTSAGSKQLIDGEHYSGYLSRAITNNKFGWRNVSFTDTTDNFKLTNYSIDRTIYEARVFNGASTTVDGIVINLFDYDKRNSVQGQFTVSAPFTNGQPLQVSVELSFYDHVRVALDNPLLEFPGRDPEIPFEWQAGSVSMLANDGSSMTMLPQAGNSFLLKLGTGETLGPFSSSDEFLVRTECCL